MFHILGLKLAFGLAVCMPNILVVWVWCVGFESGDEARFEWAFLSWFVGGRVWGVSVAASSLSRNTIYLYVEYGLYIGPTEVLLEYEEILWTLTSLLGFVNYLGAYLSIFRLCTLEL